MSELVKAAESQVESDLQQINAVSLQITTLIQKRRSVLDFGEFMARWGETHSLQLLKGSEWEYHHLKTELVAWINAAVKEKMATVAESLRLGILEQAHALSEFK